MIQLRANVRRFRPQSLGRRKLPFPATPGLRIAQITAAASLFDLAGAFPPERWEELESYRPHVLLGAPADLEQLVERTRSLALDLSSVDHAIFVLTKCGNKPATDVLRVVLWQAFGVPVYELLVRGESLVLASECEAHEGWHVENGAAFSVIDGELVLNAARRNGVRTGLTGFIETEPCPCGRAGLRLMDVEQMDGVQTDSGQIGAPAGSRPLAAIA